MDLKSFKDKFVKSPEDTKIEGFINDSDIYEFYLKFRNDIDELYPKFVEIADKKKEVLEADLKEMAEAYN